MKFALALTSVGDDMVWQLVVNFLQEGVGQLKTRLQQIGCPEAKIVALFFSGTHRLMDHTSALDALAARAGSSAAR